MDDSDPTPATDLAAMEARFLAAMGETPVPLEGCLDALLQLHDSAQTATANSWAQLLRDRLVEAGNHDALARLLSVWSGWRENDRAFTIACRDALTRVCKDRAWIALVESVAFTTVPLRESLRRLELLRACQPGAFCIERTWGFGVIRRQDDFYKRITIDFHAKTGHQMTFAYAAEVLELPDPAHILARRHRDPQAFAALVRDDPAEIVRLALRSFGPMPVTRMETLLAEHSMVAAGDWKRFWEAARKALKNDPLVEIPARRTESLIIHAQAPTFGDAHWFKVFGSLRDPEEILAAVLALESSDPAVLQQPEAHRVVSERLAFAVKGAHNTAPALYARLAVTAARLGVTSPTPDELRAHLWQHQRFIKAAERLTARDAGQMVAFLMAGRGDAAARLLEALPSACYTLTSETVEQLQLGETATATQLRCRELLASTAAPPTLLVWVLRNRGTVAGWPLPSPYELLSHAVAVVEDKNLTGELLRMSNQLHGLFANARWFDTIFADLTAIQQEAVFDRIQGSGAWDPATHRALINRMIKANPLLAGRKRSEAIALSQPVGRWTSWRSLRDRQLQYKQLIEVEIPRNSQDIATARSYGDLRENFEYHAAKHQQGLLLQRKSEWENDLDKVRGTDFVGIPTDRAGMGTRVTITAADSRVLQFHILGEWDRDEALGIISNRSRMAQCLDGKRVGESATVPGETGDESVTVTAIEPLTPEVRAWISASAELV